MERRRGVACESSRMDPAFRNAAVASLVLIFVASCSSTAVAVAVDLCRFVVADERDADVFASNPQFRPENTR